MAASAAAAAGGAGLPGKRKCAGGPSALPLLLFLAVALAVMATPSAAAQYKVGDSSGWTLGVNYSDWASSKTFRVGDTLVFEYIKEAHNVLDVSQADFGDCKTQSPKATYTTGKDTIPLRTAGHHFFICGVPTHCPSGQKVDINVLASASAAPSASPTASPGSPSPSAPPASSPEAGGSPGAGSGEGAAPSPPKNLAAPGASGNYVMVSAVALLAASITLLRL